MINVKKWRTGLPVRPLFSLHEFVGCTVSDILKQVLSNLNDAIVSGDSVPLINHTPTGLTRIRS
jgi:hypothetical protein